MLDSLKEVIVSDNNDVIDLKLKLKMYKYKI